MVMRYEVVETRTEPTVKLVIGTESYYLHSKYNPVKEAYKWVSGIEAKKKHRSNLAVVGMGAGHHIRALLKEVDDSKIVVFDFNDNYTNWVLKSGLINDLILDKRVTYYSINNKKGLEEFRSALDENFIIYEPSLKLFTSQYKRIKDKLENYLIQERTIIDQRDQFHENYMLNIKLKDPGINKYKKPEKTTMILVSAGPSLTKQLPLLKKASLSEHYTIGAVGTAYKPLMHNGIVPNFVMISDPKQAIVDQFYQCETNTSTLFYLSTANNQAVSNFKGPRYIIWQDGYCRAEEEAKKRQEPLINTGGSVATSLLDLMVFLGAKKIALIGQDLAFTNGKSHAEDTHAIRTVRPSAFFRKVSNYYQNETVYTSRNLSIYLDWFAQYIIGKNFIEFWNCTEGGAYIDGWKHDKFENYLGIESTS
ncbi:motility associated factor glycosyltransferase family protein [Bacillus infantis]|uniref:motility associated factor glycosyltransferase family protein n=1 Tax=Bacillus infantis TaxID=324767 RepID=UPI003CE98B39